MHRFALCLLALAACNVASADPKPAAPGPSCTLVSQVLTSFEVGNYASKAERQPREHELEGKCTAAKLSLADRQCIVKSTKDTLAYCAHPITVAHVDGPVAIAVSTTPVSTQGLPGNCAKLVATLNRYATCSKIPAESRPAILSAAKQMADNLRNLPQEGIAAANDACNQAVVAMHDSLKSIGCQ